MREWCLAAFDVRATAIEIVARWVNLQHLARLPVYEQQLVALEVLQVFAPLGHALGLGPISAQMEDMCFQVGRDHLLLMACRLVQTVVQSCSQTAQKHCGA